MDIHKNQNSPNNLKLLTAQRQFYNWAKSWIILNYSITFIIAVYAPIGYLLFPESRFAIGAIGAAWTLISLLINLKEQALISKAARIQEQFDTEVYGLQWNKVIAGEKVSPEEIEHARGKYKGDVNSEFQNWYLGLEDVPYPKSVLLAQRQNLSWDYRLRRQFALILIVVVLLVFTFGVVVSILEDARLLTYIIGLFLPSLSAFIKGIREIIGHYKIANEKERMERHINTILSQQNIPTQQDIRTIQDKIFLERSKAPMIPNFIYQWLKKSYSDNARAAVDQITGKS